jgi:hypothetical protein
VMNDDWWSWFFYCINPFTYYIAVYRNIEISFTRLKTSHTRSTVATQSSQSVHPAIGRFFGPSLNLLLLPDSSHPEF